MSHFHCRLSNRELGVLGGWGNMLLLPPKTEPRASFQSDNNYFVAKRFSLPSTRRLRNKGDPQSHCIPLCSLKNGLKECRHVETMRVWRFLSFLPQIDRY